MTEMLNTTAALGRFGLFIAAVSWRMAVPPWEIRAAIEQIWLVAWRCLLPVWAVVFPFGMVMALQGMELFDLFGAQRMLSSLVSVATVRELAPVMASLLVAAQTGSSFAAELGAMRIREELDATVVMGIDPIRVHVVPRVIGVLMATPMLYVFGCFAGIAGGYLVAVVIKGEPGGIYLANLWTLMSMSDVFGGLVKTVIFGWIIGMVGCYQGFFATGGAAGVGRAVNDTVVLACTTFIVANYFLTSALFGAIQ